MVTPLQTSVALAMPVLLVRVSAGQLSVRLGGSVSAGAVESRTVMVCTITLLLLQESSATQRRRIVRALPQLLLTLSLKLTLTALQVSVAVARPVALVAVLPPHSTVTFAGALRTGGVMSRTVRVWTQLDWLPQASVARHVREMTRALPHVVTLESENVNCTALQMSLAVALPVLFVEMSAGQSSVRLAGQTITGGVVSRTVMICVQLEVLPQGSVAVHRRLMEYEPPHAGVLVSMNVMLTPERSVAVA
jgi:hypothetical protein